MTDLDKVRLMIGDTDINDRLLENEEIEWLLREKGNIYDAAAAACAVIAANFARYVDQTVGKIRAALSDKAKQYFKLEQLIRQREIIPMPYAGGISRSDKWNRASDSDRVKPKFGVDMDEIQT